ncbi:DUF29 family protein [Pseudoduganella sp. FT26W]|uniref:DUF29 family protein n=1 Tax=Duganella aquatilis TaxID=2666082 RepID=A0A844DG37_9BURK|nr:DUF29 domain-containing protein [Duganella aquatilis]MRW87164.1 DUF29 family protein [Duganella aquatilis]
MSTAYEEDVAAWAQEQVALLRSGQWALLDIEHIAEEIEDMNISHRHQLAHRMAILMAHMLKWKYQPERRGTSWKKTMRDQRERIARLLEKMPSLRPLLDDPEWNAEVWSDALSAAILQAGLTDLPKACEWSLEQVLAEDYFPS